MVNLPGGESYDKSIRKGLETDIGLLSMAPSVYGTIMSSLDPTEKIICSRNVMP